MSDESRRIVVAMLAAMMVFIAYQWVINYLYPLDPPSQQQTTTAPSTQPGGEVDTGIAATAPAPGLATLPGRPESAPGYALEPGQESPTVVLGGQPGNALRLELTPFGAGITTLEITQRAPDGRFLFRNAPQEDAPYQLLQPASDGSRIRASFATNRLLVGTREEVELRLFDVPWALQEHDSTFARYSLTLRAADGGGLLLNKLYRLRPDKPVFDVELTITNEGTQTQSFRIEQDAAVGIRREDPIWDMRRLMAAFRSGPGVELGRPRTWGDLKTATLDRERGSLRLLEADKGPLLWTAVANKYFAVFTRPVNTTPNGDPTFVIGALGLVLDPHQAKESGDLLARLVLRPMEIAPGQTLHFPFEVYAGPKDAKNAGAANPVYADKLGLHYHLAMSADMRCACTFLWLEELMIWLMAAIHGIVHNYGVAILFVVIIVRGILHPLTVFQQKSMFRMQESMARIQPKMEALKEKYKSDPQSLNREMMKMWGEEGVNPFGSILAFIPLFLQMPILIALYTALNTNVNLRHAPFTLWITDLSAPDALIDFGSPVALPILGWLPLIGTAFTFNSLNLLPILMGFSMWLQQKYMPKPHLKARMEAAKANPQPKRAGGMTPEEQIRQQQMIAYLMAILFPIMFYRMPSGLVLYWMFTNIFGIGESLLIRRQIDREKQARAERATAGAPTDQAPRKAGPLSRFFRHIAEQAEELQRKADEVSKTQLETQNPKKNKKKP
ncbi:MAG: YidC/Oxa1 family insertase periplasmic-domain containing protein [Phycisphaerales bacterium]|nr:YidC/Oxa1 family insertase periplasmic-domain containing protein [Phycisphaerales bacterium]